MVLLFGAAAGVDQQQTPVEVVVAADVEAQRAEREADALQEVNAVLGLPCPALGWSGLLQGHWGVLGSWLAGSAAHTPALSSPSP